MTNGRECMMRRGVQESGLTVLPVVWHRPVLETSIICLIFSAINIDLDYTSLVTIRDSYHKKADFKKGRHPKPVFLL